jgi:hypothetical protein
MMQTTKLFWQLIRTIILTFVKENDQIKFALDLKQHFEGRHPQNLMVDYGAYFKERDNQFPYNQYGTLLLKRARKPFAST